MPKQITRRAVAGAGRDVARVTRPGSVSTPPHAPRPPGRVRIVGGTWKRTPLPVADGTSLRPTPDRVRETLFNWLAVLRPETGSLRGLDLFAGSGALGFELASRGAQQVVLVEREPRQVQVLRALKERLRAASVDVRAGDAFRVAAGLPPASFDVVFLDPPFDTGLLWPAIRLAVPLLRPRGLVYVEAAEPVAAADATASGLQIVRAARAGRVCFHLLAIGTS